MNIQQIKEIWAMQLHKLLYLAISLKPDIVLVISAICQHLCQQPQDKKLYVYAIYTNNETSCFV